ncbi:MAG: glycosyltransferase, partial [Candidatus Eremiobacteraeota bacterium]|nr:glycosyltransferase [Candidatus Eremiobacteraeota bacterium]
MKVLHLIGSAGFYGAEAMLLNLMTAQQRLGAEPALIAFSKTGSAGSEVAIRARGEGLRADVFEGTARFEGRALKTIAEAVVDRRIQLIHSHGYKADFYAFLLSRRTGVPFAATCHLWTRSTTAIRLYEWLDARILCRANAVVAVSETIAHDLRSAGISERKISVIHNGIETSKSVGAKGTLRAELGLGSATLIGAVGRLDEQKGYKYLIEAAEGIIREDPGVYFAVIGDGPLRNS